MELPSEYLVTFQKVVPGSGGGWNTQTGKYEEVQPSTVDQQGIILPLSTDDLKFSEGGTFSVHDRKIYTDLPLKIGSEIKYEEDSYTIRAEKDYSKQADVYIYFAKRIGE